VSPTSVYGSFITETEVEDLILENLKHWLPSYLGEVSEHAGKGRADLPGIKTWGAPQGDLRTRPENTLPHLAVVSPGTDGDPSEDGEGTYRAWWLLEVTTIVSSTGFAQADRGVRWRRFCGAGTRTTTCRRRTRIRTGRWSRRLAGSLCWWTG
jgi:hypothetical protein